MRRIEAARAVLLAALLGAAGAARAADPGPRVFLIGLDGATWDVMLPMMAAGRLPNLSRLVHDGSSGVLLSDKAWLNSPSMWTSIATGRKVEDHGVTGFWDGTNRITRLQRRTNALWNLLDERGKRVFVDGFLATWPAEGLRRGVVVSERVFDPDVADRVAPADLLDDYGPAAAWNELSPASAGKLRRFIGADFDPAAATRESRTPEDRRQRGIRDHLAWVYMRDESLVRIAEEEVPRLQPDFFAIHLWGTDQVAHGYFRYLDPPAPGEDPMDRRNFGEALERYYEFADEAVGRLLRLADPGVTVLVVSDHGFSGRTDENASALTGRHEPQGVVIARGPGIRRGGVLGASVFDVTPTVLHVFGFPVARDMAGRPIQEMIEPGGVLDRPVEWVETYETSRTVGVPKPDLPLSSPELIHLRAVGYIK